MFEILSSDTSLRDKLERNNNHFRGRIKEAGFDILGTSPIVPIMLYDAKLATDFANDMLERGSHHFGVIQ